MVLLEEDAKPFVQVAAGIQRRALAVGERALLTEFSLEEGAVIPVHKHPHEQIGYLKSGRIIFLTEGKEYPLGPGSSWAIPGETEHSVRVLEKAEVLEIFIPIREDYL